MAPFASFPTPPRTPTPPSLLSSDDHPSQYSIGHGAGRILFVDAYDSFTNNIISLFREVLGQQIDVIHIDDEIPDFAKFVQQYDAVIAGPGPGHPKNPKDIGLIAQLWRLPPHLMRPVFAICLGFQSLVLEFGGRVEELAVPKHGIVSPIIHQGRSMFDILEGNVLSSTRYHSLRASLPLEESGAAQDPWAQQGQLIPLAYAVDRENGSVLMSVKHVTLPFFGVQFHPESICSDRRSFARIIDRWSRTIRSRLLSKAIQPCVGPESVNPRAASPSTPPLKPVYTEVLPLGNLETADLEELLDMRHHAPTSQLESVARPGRYSILVPRTTTGKVILQYVDGAKAVSWFNSDHILTETVPLSKYDDSVWDYINDFLHEHAANGGHPGSPFWGGMIGYFSYEIGLGLGSGTKTGALPGFPDISLQFVTRSLVIDHYKSRVFVQSIDVEDSQWVLGQARCISSLQAKQHRPEGTRRSMPQASPISVHRPLRNDYVRAFDTCKAAIKTGNSYELCLTDQTRLEIPQPAGEPDRSTSFARYQSLRRCNPAPYAAYLYHPHITVLSSSPERFMSWTRDGCFEMRPIKGTVKKTASMTRERATQILSTDKERAENMMIADLVRHDLAGALGSGDEIAKVEGEFGRVEEYETVFQLVSVIQGHLSVKNNLLLNGSLGSPIKHKVATNSSDPPSKQTTVAPTGLDVLRATLPPGSMTGAPKRRTCELLHEIERQEPRRVYSGVLGYLDVGGGGDFSVVIRTAFRWTGESVATNGNSQTLDRWRIGAGGAITQLSTEEDEWEEMNTKLNSTLRAFTGGQV